MTETETRKRKHGNGNTHTQHTHTQHTHTRKRKHGKYCASYLWCCLIAHVFFEICLPVSASVLSGTRLPRFPDQGRLFSASFGCSFIYSMSGDQDCIIILISSDLLLARMKTCCQSRSNGSESWRLLPYTLLNTRDLKWPWCYSIALWLN